MSIRVTCGKCHTRFNVSDKFAGKKGPCPKCKTTIKIPAKDEQVVVHEPELAGPKSKTGESILKPIEHKEVKITGIHITLIVSMLVLFLICALVFNFSFPEKENFPSWILWISALAIAPPICFAGYAMLRDRELGGYAGSELWTRVLVCSAVYALLWFAMPIGKYAFSDSYETGSWILALFIMGGGGAAAGMLSFDLDYLMGLVHFGLYMTLCIVGRLLSGIGALPGWFGDPTSSPAQQFGATSVLEHSDLLLSNLSIMLGA